MFNISSNSVASSTKAYCPLMGNLQSKFHFFIKNQQATDEKVTLLYSLPLPFFLLYTHTYTHICMHKDTLHFSSLSSTASQFIIIIIIFFLPVERENPFSLEVQNVTAT